MGTMARLVAVATAIVLTATTMQAAPAMSDTGDWTPPPTQPVKSVPVRPVHAKLDTTPDPAKRATVRSVPKATWPSGAASVELPSAARTAITGSAGAIRAGLLPVWIQAAPSDSASTAKKPSAGLAPPSSVDRVRVEVAGRSATDRVGVTGVLLRLEPEEAGEIGSEVATPEKRETAARKGGAASQGVRLTLDYSMYQTAFGADWSRRLRLVQLPECAWSTPEQAACQQVTPLTSENDESSRRLSGKVELTTAGGPTVIAALAGSSSDAGDFAATSLTASSTWAAGGSSGDFTWSYPFRVPPAVGGPEPSVALSYSAQSVDGRQGSTNNQPSWIGEGFDLGMSYVERKYGSCADDGHAGKGDLCWKYDNATLSLNGKSTELVKDDKTGAWRLKDDDGSRVQRLTNPIDNGDNDREYWKVTTTDGTQYHFGLYQLPGWTSGKPTTNSVLWAPVAGDDADAGDGKSEPCYSSSGFASSFCNQAWRWMLDYVVDPNGNVMSYYYGREGNFYAKNGVATPGTQYMRGAILSRIEYGQRSNTIYSTPTPFRVLFGTAQRCVPTSTEPCTTLTSTNQGAWPDVPFDQLCASGQACTGKTSPTFFSQLRLSTIRTQVWVSGTTYRDVDTWTLTQSFPSPGDGTSAALWLTSIAQTGKVGEAADAITLPKVVFGGTQLTNRVDALEGIAPLRKWRVRTITSETGGRLQVNYTATECSRSALPAVDTNTKRCFPSYWTPPGKTQPELDWFHKYLAAQVLQIDQTGGAPTVQTGYSYPANGAAWHYDDTDGITPNKYRTWSQWRGYTLVTTTLGDSLTATRSQSTARYFRGMDGDRLSGGGTKNAVVTDSEGVSVDDANHLAGIVRETRVLNGVGGAEVSGEISDPWVRQTAFRDQPSGDIAAHIVRVGKSRTRTTLDGDRGVRGTTSVSTFTDDGLIATVDDQGDDATTGDDQCTRTTYAQDTDTWMLDYPSRVETVSVKCAGTPSRPDDVISDVRTAYDTQAVGAAPTKGDATRSERVASYSGGSPVYQTVSTSTYDAHGRVRTVTDADDKTTTTTYTPATGGPLTQTVEKNPLGHTLTTKLEAAWGSATSIVDTNGENTDLAYDALGRLKSVWLANRTQEQQPNLRFAYSVTATAPPAVATSTLRHDGTTFNTSYDIFDSWLRPRQTQRPGANGGRVVADTIYDKRGLVEKTRADFYNSAVPGAGLVSVTDAGTPALTSFTYDGVGRESAQTLTTSGQQRWQTTTRYGGDRTYVDPPTGAPGVTTITDARGNVVERREHPGGAPSGSFTATTYSYDHADRLAGISDVAGNDWTYTYDLRGRQTSTSDPDKGTTVSTYDDLDRVATSTDARGEKLAYSYDALGRKTGLFAGSTAGTKLAEWTFDTIPGAEGMPVASTRYIDGAAYTNKVVTYDELYRPTREETVIPAAEEGLGGTYRKDYTYNLDGTLDTAILPQAGGLPLEILTQSYNDLGMPTTLEGRSSYVKDTVYSPLGDPEQYILARALDSKHVSLTMEYEDGTRRLKRAYADDQTNTELPTDRSFTYDAAGNVLSATEVAGTPDEVECYRYDGYQRLADSWTQASGGCSAGPSGAVLGGPAPYWTSWTYTSTGQRKTQTAHLSSGDVTSTFVYPAAGKPQPHAVQSITNGSTVKKYVYDEAGNTTSRVNHSTGATQTLDWDGEGRLESVTEGGDVSGLVYDADGTLLLRRDAAETVLYVGETEVHESAAGAISAQRHYSHNGQTVAVRATDGAGGTKISWLVGDPQNTALVAIDEGTQQASRRRQNPFGVLRSNPTWPSTRGFVGGVPHKETGLTHLGAREYDPATGNFLSADPVLDPTSPQSLNAYSYAGNNPVTLSDPSGLYPIDEWGDPYPAPPRVPAGDGAPYDGGQSRAHREQVREVQHANQQVTRARGAKEVARKQLVKAAQAVVTLMADELGITDAVDCFTTGDTGSCLSTAGTVLLSFVGGVAGKLVVKYGAPWKWRRAARVAGELGRLSGDLASGLRAYAKHSDELANAERNLARVASACGMRSFAGSTLVLMAGGKLKPIADVKVGDRVVATDPQTGEQRVEPVTAVWVHQDKLVDLRVDAGVVTTTEDHPFWNATDREWQDAANIDPGDQLLAANGDKTRLGGIAWATQHTDTAYNLTIANIHTYHVLAGTAPVLVHNTTCPWTSYRKFDGDGHPVDGTQLPTNEALDAAERWVGPDYSEPVAGSGRYVSQDGARVARMGDSDITGRHGGGPHMNFERLGPNPRKPGKSMVIENRHVYLQ
ncbi:RHS repeat-associated core domain-containing protein [Actinopolymorpha pittospori]